MVERNVERLDMAKRIVITIEDEDFNSSPYKAKQFGEYGRYVPALTAPTRAEHPCTHCQNNPANNPHASGICNCVLPTMWQTIY